MKETKKILITGAFGFIGKNLAIELQNRKVFEIFSFDKDSSLRELETFCQNCDFVFHLAGVNRPEKIEEFNSGNVDFTKELLNRLKKYGNKAPIVFSSSTQAELDNQYGKSKLAAEEALMAYSKENRIPVLIYRLPNVFGKWCRPSYNSVVATFCHNIANDIPVHINDPAIRINLLYIDDLVTDFISRMSLNKTDLEYIDDLEPVHQVTIGDLAAIIESFRELRMTRGIPDVSDNFLRKLYATYLSYLPKDRFKYQLKMNTDNRGSFTEFIKTSDRGQISVNISKPGIVKGNHWHHTKNEKFLVVSGSGVIRFRKVGTTEVFEYKVSGNILEVVDIPPGYTHNIENAGDSYLITIMWVSEFLDPDKTDTFFEMV